MFLKDLILHSIMALQNLPNLMKHEVQTCTPQLRLAKKYAINEKSTIFARFCSNFQKLIIPWVGQYLKVGQKLRNFH